MFLRIIIICFLLCLATLNCIGQLEKANSYFQIEQYAEAIKAYTKILKNDSMHIEATQNLAYAYKKLNDYTNAEKFYKKAIIINPKEPSNYLYLGQVLKNTNKLNLAKQQFQILIEMQPTNVLAKMLLKSIDDISVWEMAKNEFVVTLLDNINTTNAEFCPYFYNQDLIFVSDRQKDLLNEKYDGVTNKPYYSILYANEKQEYKKVKAYSTQLNTTYHDGPLSISSDGKTIYFTRSVKRQFSNKVVNYSKIYQATLNKKRWKNSKELTFNSEHYSVAHPAISSDGNTLYYTSNKPGGFGGMDLYKVIKTEEGWSEPKNLGEEINTPYNEMFPYFSNDMLYFSSDKPSGYGGLDIYAISFANNQWKLPIEHFKAPLNSGADDYGISFKDKDSGYFSSNRQGGVGGDDIYSFKQLAKQELSSVTGLLVNNVSNSSIKIQLLNENNQVLQAVLTDTNGSFEFNNLIKNENYLIKVISDNDMLLRESELYLTNQKGEKVLQLQRVEQGIYKFKALAYSYFNTLEKIVDTEETLLTINIYGQVYKKLPGDYSNGMQVFLIDEEENIIKAVTTDNNGKFIFKKLSPGETYLFKLEENDQMYNVIITDENGKLVYVSKRISENIYKYTRLNTEKTIITLLNENDEIIKIEENESFIISKIFYAYDSYELNELSKNELNKLISILQKNPKLGVKLNAHTDDIGSETYNVALSQKRANAALDYILSKGIDKKRVLAKGYGKSIPIAPNQLPSGADNPNGRSKNRRTEFSLIQLLNE